MRRDQWEALLDYTALTAFWVAIVIVSILMNRPG